MRAAAFLAGLALAWPAAAQGPDFTFRDAEFMPPGRAVAVAQSFVSKRFPPGLPMSEALARARRAAMSCRPSRDGVSRVCRYSVPVHADGGVIGDDTWTVRLAPDGAGALASATLAYRRDSGAVE